jgi:hypothetical protein
LGSTSDHNYGFYAANCFDLDSTNFRFYIHKPVWHHWFHSICLNQRIYTVPTIVELCSNSIHNYYYYDHYHFFHHRFSTRYYFKPHPNHCYHDDVSASHHDFGTFSIHILN